MKRLILFLLTIFLTISCSEETEVKTEVIDFITDEDGSTYESYQNGKCTRYYNTYYTYSTSTGLLASTYTPATSTSSGYSRTITYNSDKTLASYDYRNLSTNVVTRYVFTYSLNIINKKEYQLPNTSYVLSQENFTTKDNLIIKRNATNSNSLIDYTYDEAGNLVNLKGTSFEYKKTYDNKPSRNARNLKAMYGDNYRITALLLFAYKGYEFTNNIVQETATGIQSPYTFTATYEYNKSGEVATKKDSNGGVLTYYYK